MGSAVFLAVIARPASADEAELQSIPTFSVDLTTTDETSESHFTITLAPGVYRDAAGDKLIAPQAVDWVCIGKQDNPHYSKGAGGVISKARVTCSGPNATLRIKVSSVLAKAPTNNVSKLKILASSEYVQNVVANGQATTWYVPKLGEPGVTRGAAGYWRASHVGVSMPPLLTFATIPGASQMTFIPAN